MLSCPLCHVAYALNALCYSKSKNFTGIFKMIFMTVSFL